MIPKTKNVYIKNLTKSTHDQSRIYFGNTDSFFSGLNGSSVVLSYFISYAVLRYTEKIQRLFVPKFYHDRRNTNFLYNLKYIGEKKEIDEKFFF